ncbi:hypothetical protein D3C86_1302220 [compost metagenome]
MLFKGVLSSWLILARNSDLYLLEISSSSALRLMASLAWLTAMLRSSSCCAFSSSSALVWRSSSCCTLNSSSEAWSCSDLYTSSSLVVRNSSCWLSSSSACCCVCSNNALSFTRATALFTPTPILSRMVSRNKDVDSSGFLFNPSSITAMVSSSKMTGIRYIQFGAASPSPELTLI